MFERLKTLRPCSSSGVKPCTMCVGALSTMRRILRPILQNLCFSKTFQGQCNVAIGGRMYGTCKSNTWMLSMIHKTMTSRASAMPKRAPSKLIVPIFDPLTEVCRHRPCLLVVAVSNSPVSLWLELLGKRSRALCLANHEQLPLVCACGIAAQGHCYALLVLLPSRPLACSKGTLWTLPPELPCLVLITIDQGTCYCRGVWGSRQSKSHSNVSRHVPGTSKEAK
jgi:hypothetical protein